VFPSLLGTYFILRNCCGLLHYPPDAVEPLLLELRGMDEDSRLAAAGVGAAFAASFPSMPDER
jgi:hypothetical protein